ncbi:hypothetical protein GCM10029992_17020 [Glycomyces albus]
MARFSAVRALLGQRQALLGLGDDPLGGGHGLLVPVGLLALGPLAAVGLGQGELLGHLLAVLGGLGQQPAGRGPLLVGLPGGHRPHLGDLALGRGPQDRDLPLGLAAGLLRVRARLTELRLGLALGVGHGQFVGAPGVLAHLGGLGQGPGPGLGDVLFAGGGDLGGLGVRTAQHHIGLGAGLGQDRRLLSAGLLALDGGVLLGGAQDLLHSGAESGERGLLGLGDLGGSVGHAPFKGRDAFLGAAQVPSVVSRADRASANCCSLLLMF